MALTNYHKTSIFDIKEEEDDEIFTNHIQSEPHFPIKTPQSSFNQLPLSTTQQSSFSQPTLSTKLQSSPQTTVIPSFRDSDMTNYVAMAYQIASNLRNNDPYAYKQCSRFYKNDNTIYIIVIVFLLLVCVFLSRTRN